MFNKRESSTADASAGKQTTATEPENQPMESQARKEPAAGNTPTRDAAVIGPSIEIDGDLRGEEDLIIEGSVKGTVRLKSNSLTIGAKGKVTADVYAHTINVDGTMKGDLYASERLVIRKSARVQGNIAAPRVMLEDGAKFKGTVEMDPESDSLKSAFSDSRSTTASRPTAVTDSGKSTNRESAKDAGTRKSSATG